MKKVKGLTKRIAAMLMSGMLVVGAVPGTALASENQADIGQTSEIAAEVPEGAETEEVSAEAYNQDDVAQEEEAEAWYYTVTLDANGGYFENEWDDALGETVEQAEVVEKHIPVGGTVDVVPMFTDPDGRTMVFAGWSLEKDGELIATGDEEYAPVDNCVLYAVWEVDETAINSEISSDEVSLGESVGVGDQEEVYTDENTDQADASEESAEIESEENVDSEDAIQEAEKDEIVEDTDDAQEIEDSMIEDDSDESHVEEDADPNTSTAPEKEDENETSDQQATGPEKEEVFSNEDVETISEGAVDAAIAEEKTQPTLIEDPEAEENVRENAEKGIVESGGCGENLTWMFDDEGTLTISGTGIMTDWGIMDCEDDSIAWFAHRESIKQVKILSGVTSVGDHAFRKCNNITNVTIPSSVVNIGEGAFWSCESLKSIILPDGLASIEYVAFGSCTNLTNVTIPSSLVNIGDSAFDNCKSLKSIILPDGLAGIGNRMFCYCTNLENVTIPSSVTNIGSGAFSNCTNLENVTIPSSVTNIGDGAFGDCKSLGNITIPGSVQFIGSGAFKGCESLKTIGIPSSVKVIDDRTFAGCINLTTITLPNGLTTIKGAAFTGCANLTHIEIPESVTVIEGYAFSCCFALENMTLPSGLLSIGDGVFKNCEALKDINIPDNVTKIGDYAFYECYSLDSITIPSSVTEIGKYAFEWCTHLESVIIPDGVKSIGLCAFQRCENLKTVIIPNSVTYIGISAFSNCGLTNVIIPDSVTKLERETFFYCEKLKSVIIPLSVKSIGFQTFGACDNLQEASYLGTEENWASVDVDSGNTPLLNAIHFTNFPTQESFIVSFDANGGTGTPSSQIKQENVSLTLSSIKPSKRYTISYNSCGGSVSPASKSVNCTFKNWNTAKNGSGTSYASGGNYSSNADATLYAQWTNPKAGELATPTRSGYAFVGWYTASSGGNQVTDSSAITGNVTLYAHWKDPYNLGDETYSFENYGDYHRDGHCFGMSITSAGYYNNLLDIRRIGGNTNTPLFSFGDTQTVREPICYYSDIQGTYSNRAIVAGGSHYKYGFFNLSSDWQSVVDYVKNHRYDNTGLLQIGLRKKKPNKISGHAVNFLRYEKVNGQDRIYAYDNNFPNVETYFYQDSSGKVLQYPVATYRDGIDCICLRDASIYFSNVGDFDFTHVLHMDNNTTLVEGYTFSYMDGDSDDSEYVMYEIPANQDRVTIIPKKNDANFIYMDTEFSFGEITDNTRGILKLSSMDQDSGGLDASFIIYEESESAIIPTVTLSKNTFTYNGKVQKPAVTVKAGSKVLTESQDYIVEYPSGMVDVGSYKVKITLIGNYSGVLYDTYEIVKATQPLAASNLSLTYQKNGTIKVSGNKGKLTYKSSNTSVATVDSTGKVTAKGAGKATITITAAATSNYNAATKTITVNVAKAAQSITAKAGASTIAVGKTTTVSINGNKGTKSYKSSNTTIATVTSAGKVTAKKVGTVKITATSAATAQYNAASKTVTIKVVPAATTSLTAANQATGIKLTWKKVTGANGYKVYRGSTLIKTITSVNTVTFADTKANTNGTKYTYKVVAKASTGDSTLSKSVAVYRVARPAISSATNSASKKMTVKWGKNAKANGYQIQYSTDKTFKSGNKAVTVTGASTVSKVIGSLTKGKTYYVRIRTYKTVGSAKYWSVWSSARSVKISK